MGQFIKSRQYPDASFRDVTAPLKPSLALDFCQGLRATGSLQCRINQEALIGGNGARQ
jgi:hypothetical protein